MCKNTNLFVQRKKHKLSRKTTFIVLVLMIIDPVCRISSLKMDGFSYLQFTLSGIIYEYLNNIIKLYSKNVSKCDNTI